LAMNDSVASRAGPTLADLILKFGWAHKSKNKKVDVSYIHQSHGAAFWFLTQVQFCPFPLLSGQWHF
jgi:hypothetical protein